MEFFRIKRDIPFMRYALIFNIISFATFAAAVYFLATRGLHLSIEFTGGSVIEVQYDQAADLERVRKSVESLGAGEVQVQNFGSSRDVLIRIPVNEGVKQTEQVQRVFGALCAAEQGGAVGSLASTNSEAAATTVCQVGDRNVISLQRNEFVGPQVGSELARDGALALLFSVIGIMLYLSFRFEWKFSVASVVANLHDVIIILGFFAYFQWEFSLSVLAAVLAVMGYSVNESVVIFDRIRETFRRYRKLTPPQVINHAITSTISRTIITHGSTQMMVVAMLIFGGPTLHYFALALTVGILFGIYSSVFVAAAIAMWLGVKREDLMKNTRKEVDPNDPNAGAVV